MKKINIKSLLFYLISTFVIGCLFVPLTNSDFYKSINKPFTLPPVIFIIVWTILYILMSISIYRVRKNKTNNILYYINMGLNSIWTLIFFGLKNFLLSSIILILILIIVIIMFIRYRKEDKVSSNLLIPYIIWLLIAGFLNLSIYFMN